MKKINILKKCLCGAISGMLIMQCPIASAKTNIPAAVGFSLTGALTIACSVLTYKVIKDSRNESVSKVINEENADYKKRNRELEKKIKSIRGKYDMMTIGAEKLSAKIHTLNEKNETLEYENRHLREIRQDYKRAADDSERLSNEFYEILTDENSHLRERSREFQEQIDDLYSQNQELQRSIDALRERIRILNDENESLRHDAYGLDGLV